MAQETVIILNKDTRWTEAILSNGSHFVVSFPVEECEDDKKTLKIYVRRMCKNYILTKEETLEITGKKYAVFDFPFHVHYDNYVDEAAVDVYIEIGTTLTKKITFTYE